MVWSGPEEPSCDVNLVHPVYDEVGFSGINSLTVLGYAKGFNMNGTSPVAAGFKLPLVDMQPVVKLLGGVGTGYPDMDGNGITDQVIVNSDTDETWGAFPQDTGDGVSNPAYQMLPSLPPDDFRVLGFPDLDGDGNTDYCVQHIATGWNYCYGMSGNTIIWEGPIPSLGDYITLGFPDLDGVNGQDVCLQHSTGPSLSGYTYCYLVEVDLKGGGELPPPTWPREGPIPSPEGYSTLGFPQLAAGGAREYCVVIMPGGTYTYCYQFNATGNSETDTFGIVTEGSIPGPKTSSYKTFGFPQLDKLAGDDTCVRVKEGEPDPGFSVCYMAADPWTDTWSAGEVIPFLPTDYSSLNWPDLDCNQKQDYVIQHDPSKYTVAYLRGNGQFGPPVGNISPDNSLYTTKAWAINGKDPLPQQPQ
jgi:hypothetical protein